MPLNRRQLFASGATLLAGAAPVAKHAIAQAVEPQVVRIVAQRFRYTPAEVHVKAGAPITLEFTSLDFVHGFNIPDFDMRADLVPGRVTRVQLPSAKPGVYEFVCDNFCGDHHEEMHGRLVVDA